LAALSRLPRLRSDLTLKKLVSHKEGEPYLMVRDDLDSRYFRFPEWVYDLVLLLDGRNDVDRLVTEFAKKQPEHAMDTQEMVDYVEILRLTGLLEKTEQEKHLVMMDKLKTLRKRRFLNPEVESMFKVEFKLFDPNTALDRVMPWIRWVWSGWCVAFWAAVFVFVLGFLLYHWDMYWAGFFDLIRPKDKTFWDWVGLIALVFGVSIWHELGHGFTCKRFGGEVHNIGFMIFYFEPAFYCRIDDTYLFPNRFHRIYAAAGGSYFELMLCSVAMGVWLLTPAELWLHQLALSLVFITGLSVTFNMNPLIKLDGYFMLLDLLDLPDLREDSFKYLGNLIKRHVFHLQVSEEPISRRRRRIYFMYSIGAVLYTSTIIIVIYSLFRGWIVGWLGPIGYLVIFALTVWLMRRKLKEGLRFMGHLWLDKKDLLLSQKGLLVTGSATLVALLLLTVLRSPTRIEARFVVEPVERTVVRAPSDGVVVAIHTDEGQRVAAGTVLFELASPDLEASVDRAEADLALAHRGAIAATEWGDIVTASKHRREASEAADRLKTYDALRDELTLTASSPGVVTSWDLDQLEGRYVMKGEQLCAVDRIDVVRLAIATAESDVSEIEAGDEVRLLAQTYPGRTLRAEVLGVAPVAEEPGLEERETLDLIERVNLVRVLVEIDNADGRLRPGMTGRVQFLTTDRSALGKTWWRFRRWAESVVW
jgi:putative peptide zinc metalloprotease protein